MLATNSLSGTTPRERVASLLEAALVKEGCTDFSVFDIYQDIWTPMGGERGLDIARWDVTVRCQRDGFAVPLHVHSWFTLSDFKSCKKIKLTPHSHREYEASPMTVR